MDTNKMSIQLAAIAENKEICTKIVSDFVRAKTSINGDKTENIRIAIKEAFSNVIDHAYGNTKGSVYISVKISNNTITIKITDKGKGISEDLSEVMEPLYSTGDPEFHSGLGFTVMDVYSDSLSVKTKVGKGTTITLKFNYN